MAVQVLTRLGADPNQTRQQVIQLLHGPHAAETVAESIRPSRHPGTPSGLDAIRDRLDTIAGQLAAVVTRLGIGGQAPPGESVRRPEPRRRPCASSTSGSSGSAGRSRRQSTPRTSSGS